LRGGASTVLLDNVYFWNRAHGSAYANWSTLIYLRARENQVRDRENQVRDMENQVRARENQVRARENHERARKN
jgi:hypothetical protein